MYKALRVCGCKSETPLDFSFLFVYKTNQENVWEKHISKQNRKYGNKIRVLGHLLLQTCCAGRVSRLAEKMFGTFLWTGKCSTHVMAKTKTQHITFSVSISHIPSTISQ